MNTNFYETSKVTQHSLVLTFAWMTLGLMITAITSAIFAMSGLYLWILIHMPFLTFGLLIGQIVLTLAFTVAMRKSSASLMKVLFIVYAVTFGFSLSSLAFAYGIDTLALAFLVSAAYFVCLAIIGITTKKDFTGIGTYAFSALIALIVTQVIFMIFRIPMNTRFMCMVGLLIFTGITIFDVQRANRLLTFENGDVVTQEKIAIFLALQLYLDFINIFLRIVRLLGSRKN